jgi:transposase
VIFFGAPVRLRSMSVRRPNYAQRLLLPPSVDEWVPVGHPVRFISEFVDQVDLLAHGVVEPKGERGRPPVAADVLLKIWLYGFTQRIRSTRKLERACVEVMPFIWLTGNDPPDHNTIWRFFKDNRASLKKLFKTLMQAAAEARLVSFVLHALDGTKLQAASSTDSALHRKAIEEKLKALDQIIAQYMTEVEAAPSPESEGAQQMPKEMQELKARQQKIREVLARRVEDREDGLLGAPKGVEPEGQQALPSRDGSRDGAREDAMPVQAPPSDEGAPLTRVDEGTSAVEPAKDGTKSAEDSAPAQVDATSTSAAESQDDPMASASDPMHREALALQKELTAKLAKLDATGENHLSELEPDARMMKGRGMSGLAYNAQIVVDHDSDLIVACDVSAQCNDLKQLTPMLSEVREVYGRVADETTSDGGYDNGLELARAEAEKMPVIVRLREEPEAKGDFSKAHFEYDPKSNVYICPQGERLIQIGTNKSHASAEEPDAIYRCHNKTCPFRKQCSSDPRGRKIRRPPGEDARARQAQKQQDPGVKIKLSLRKEIVEHLFGIIKTVDGFRRFTVRGLEKVSAQWALVCLGVNLRKLAAVATWSGGKLMPLAAEAAAASAMG